MARSLHAVLKSFDAVPLHEGLSLALAEAISPDDTYPCLNPRCRQMCTWPADRGRPQRYCSAACGRAFERTRARLIAEIELLDGALRDPSVRYTDRIQLAQHVARRRWALDRYRAE